MCPYTIVLLLFVAQSHAVMNVQYGTMMQREILRIFFDVGLEDCWSNCEQRAACSSISYIRKMKLCYLNTAKKTVEETPVVGAIFREKLVQVVNTECGAENCNTWEVCDASTKTCKIKECRPSNTSDEVDTFGNMAFIGSKKLQRCKIGFLPTQGYSVFKEILCTKDGLEDHIKCVPLTCQRLAERGITSSRTYFSYNAGSGNVIKIFCEFISGKKLGYSYLSAETLSESVKIDDYYNRKDHVMLRHVRNEIQYESKIEVLGHDRGRYNVSVFNSENPDFSGNVATKPYLFFSFIPISFGVHTGHLKGYTCNGNDFSFVNCDDNRNNYFAFYESENINRKCYNSGTVKDGWKHCSTAVASSRNIPSDVFFNSYEIGMGGCGCFERSCDESVLGLALGLPFEY